MDVGEHHHWRAMRIGTKSEAIAKIQQLSRAAMDALNKCETQEDTVSRVRMDSAEARRTSRPRAWWWRGDFLRMTTGGAGSRVGAQNTCSAQEVKTKPAAATVNTLHYVCVVEIANRAGRLIHTKYNISQNACMQQLVLSSMIKPTEGRGGESATKKKGGAYLRRRKKSSNTTHLNRSLA